MMKLAKPLKTKRTALRNVNELGKDKEFEYMLKEFDYQGQLVEARIKRLEQVGAFYLTAISAIAGAIVAAAISIDGNALTLIIDLALFIATILGHFTFWQFLRNGVQIVTSQSSFYARRQYFLDMFPEANRYVGSNARIVIPNVWRYMFSRGTNLFLYLYAVFNSALFGLFIYLAAILTVPLIQPPLSTTAFEHTALTILSSLFIALGVCTLNIYGIYRYTSKAKELSSQTYQNLTNE